MAEDIELGEDGRPLGVLEAEWIARAEEQAEAFEQSEVEFFAELRRRKAIAAGMSSAAALAERC